MIYLDNAATTPVLPGVYPVMRPWIDGTKFGNPSSLHSAGMEARKAIETARGYVADLINAADAKEIVFTSGGTESDNLVIQGVSRSIYRYFRTIMVSSVEHHAILRQGGMSRCVNGTGIVRIPVDKNGVVDLDWIKAELEDQGEAVGMVSVMLVNNETGVISPIEEISDLCHSYGVLVHTDAVQAVGHMKVDVQELGVDFLSLSGHKFGAPDGIGALYVRNSAWKYLHPILYGGKQERGIRAGTENVAGIVGLGEAARIAKRDLNERIERNKLLRKEFLRGVWLNGDLGENGIRVNCGNVETLSNILSVTVEGVESESLLLMMDANDVCISAASACSAGSLEPSHVLTAMGMPEEEAQCTVRISFGNCNTMQEVFEAGALFGKCVQKIRAMYGGLKK